MWPDSDRDVTIGIHGHDHQTATVDVQLDHLLSLLSFCIPASDVDASEAVGFWADMIEEERQTPNSNNDAAHGSVYCHHL